MANIESNRSYGQGAQGELEAPKAAKPGLWTRFRYNFDNSIAKGGAFVAYTLAALVVASILIVLIKYALYAVPLLRGENAALPSPDFNTFWGTFTGILGKGGEPTWADRVIGILTWAVTITLAASVTGFAVGVINRTFEKLKKGKSAVIESGHTLILGWSNRVYPILKELAIANENVRKPLVVVFANVSREKMEDDIADHIEEGLGNLRVITRSGDPMNPTELKRANVAGAKSVIVLDADDAGDAAVVSTVLAVKAVNSNPNLKVIAEVDDPHTAKALEVATQGNVIAIRSHDVIARVTAQASRQPGLAAVTLDLLDFDGDEIYFTEVPALTGKTYRDALLAFNNASVIGVLDADGNSNLNPDSKTKLAAGDRIIAIAEDDDKVVYTGVREDIANKKIAAHKAPARKAENLLVIGWSAMGRSVLRELATFVPKGSTVHILAQKKYVADAEWGNFDFGPNLKATFATLNGNIDELIAAAEAKNYNEIIVLGYRHEITQPEADAQTMLTMLQLNQMFDDQSNKVVKTRLVAEILDGGKAELARVAAVDDLVVSDNLAALVIAQISENNDLAPVFDDLFDAEGASINLRPVDHYIAEGKTVEWAEVVAIAAAHGESAIGYRVANHEAGDASTGVVLNPAKNSQFTAKPGDGLVVIADV
jgi:Trk K+ transport system NAD-binding subunit